ncbi:hypothetical protein [Candidatus Frankia nodulisporulans]|uniref:hypothetical protein n=1 Tax=Candidatus Frankia nodulisporulans TaxID=2060052 RepID=UPI0013D0A9DB|nr:hypothetical protein [Candidatus Frankia nodulisporulans]
MITRLAAARIILAGDPLPEDTKPDTKDLPPAVENALHQILGWTLWGALFVCGVTAIISVGFAAVGRVSGRPGQFDRGLSVFMFAVACGFLVGIAIPLVNSVYGLAF